MTDRTQQILTEVVENHIATIKGRAVIHWAILSEKICKGAVINKLEADELKPLVEQALNQGVYNSFMDEEDGPDNIEKVRRLNEYVVVIDYLEGIRL